MLINSLWYFTAYMPMPGMSVGGFSPYPGGYSGTRGPTPYPPYSPQPTPYPQSSYSQPQPHIPPNQETSSSVIADISHTLKLFLFVC